METALSLPDFGDDIVADICISRTEFEIFRLMQHVVHRFGARAFMVGNVPALTAREISGSTIISSWPADMLNFYDREDMMASSPVIKRLRTSTLPFQYDVDKDGGAGEDAREFVSRQIYHRFHQQRGACFPVHEACGTRGMVIISGDRPAFSAREMKDLHYLAAFVFDRLAEIRSLDLRVAETLTQQELDCLIWTAEGKSSAEIAATLSLSEHTVNHYINRAVKKLDTLNRTQAVAKALRTGLIS